MAALGLVVGRLADVVQQAAAPGQRAVEADFLGHHAGDEGHFDAVPQHVLAVAGAEMQPAQQVDQPLVQAADGQLPGRRPRPASGCASPTRFCVASTISSMRVG